MTKVNKLIIGIFLLFMIALMPLAYAVEEEGGIPTKELDKALLFGLIAVGAGLAVGLTGIGAGMGEQGIGAAVVGVVAEDPKFLGKGLFLMLLPETLIIFGMAISLMLMFAWTPW
ncbi:MAG: hypothetical protein ACE5J9_04945 [Methanosarcinales archaeon]